MVSNQDNQRGGSGLLFFFRSARGFSLVELMIVVAIIGLLSAIAIPNFQKFQARSRTTEAKLQLAAIYTAEASFFGTYNIYHTCLSVMGYDPVEFKNTRFYTVGFNTAANINATAYAGAQADGLNPADCATNLSPADNVTYFEAGTGVGGNISTVTHLPTTRIGDQTVSDFTYTAGAGGIIHKSNITATNSSAFTINQNKIISTLRTGY